MRTGSQRLRSVFQNLPQVLVCETGMGSKNTGRDNRVSVRNFKKKPISNFYF